MSLLCPCGQGGQWCPGVYWDQHCQQVEGDHPHPLLSPGEATLGVLCAALGRSVQDNELLERVHWRILKRMRTVCFQGSQ